MGANTRTYKFALAEALLMGAQQGKESMTLTELAVPYSLSLAKHSLLYPQAPGLAGLGDQDFLSVVALEAQDAVNAGAPSERLVNAAVKSMPGMVMQKFHNLRGQEQGQVAHTFYEITGQGTSRRVILTPDLHSVAAQQTESLHSELDARWAIVETSFDPQIGRSLIGQGVELSTDGTELLSRVRRVTVSKARPALSGFQHGRCFYCNTPLDQVPVVPHVDHVFPYWLMQRPQWSGPDLNGVWNLVVACAACNLTKSGSQPSEDAIRRLVTRNEAIITSPHPIKKSLELAITTAGGGTTPRSRLAFIKAVDSATPWA